MLVFALDRCVEEPAREVNDCELLGVAGAGAAETMCEWDSVVGILFTAWKDGGKGCSSVVISINLR